MSFKKLIKRSMNLTTALALLVASSASAVTGLAYAAVINPAPAAKVSFTFDDGLASSYKLAAPTLAKYGLTGTNYVTTSCIGMTTVPNNCHADGDTAYMTWSQVKVLQNYYGWEIGSHTATHPYLASSDAEDGQPNVLTQAQVVKELADSKNALAVQGINAQAFASPYGDYNNATMAEIAKLYTSHRGFADVGLNGWPNNDYLLYNIQVQSGVSVDAVKVKIDEAIANKQWIVLTFHDIKTRPSTDPNEYEYSTANLDAIAAYVKSKSAQIKNVNVSQGLTNGTTSDNLLPNASFDNGLAQGWTTNNAAAVTRDGTNKGSLAPAGNATNAIKFSPSSMAARLHSPQVSVNASTTYLLKNFLNVQSMTGSGQVEFYIDEYDINGQWVSGQYKKAENSVYVESFNFDYKPTSKSVVKASLQVTATANSGITAYLDNVQWMPLGSNPTPVEPTVGLLANGSFEQGLTGWTTDDATNIVADNTGKGSSENSTGSAKLKANTAKTTHLFSSKVAVQAGKAYDITSYANLLTQNSANGGELGFYIDEYDAQGNWVSGQYKYGMRSTGAGDINFPYIPSSSNVASARLQVIVVANSGLTGYFDNVRWTTKD